MKRIKEIFFENPGKYFYLRQISRLSKTPKTTAARKLKKLEKQKIIKKVKSEPYDNYVANTQDTIYKFYKKYYLIEKIYQSGLIDYLEKETNPKSIFVFGSVAKGEFDKESDIDLFVQSTERIVKLEKYEKKLRHEINIIFEPDTNKISKELFKNIINGIKLYGYLK